VSSGIWAVIPVKPFELAKTRLSAALSGSERAQLARVMVEDVLETLAGVKALAGMMVVTADPSAVALAARYGAVVLREAAPTGIDAALARATRYLSSTPQAGMLMLAGDLPQASVAAVEELTRTLNRSNPVVTIVPAVRDRGTNALGCRPATIIAPSFGPRSFDRHYQAARVDGITPVVLDSSELGYDIDRPGDLSAFLSLGTSTRTHAFLSRVAMQAAS